LRKSATRISNVTGPPRAASARAIAAASLDMDGTEQFYARWLIPLVNALQSRSVADSTRGEGSKHQPNLDSVDTFHSVAAVNHRRQERW
jgi:hypothetical protein